MLSSVFRRLLVLSAVATAVPAACLSAQTITVRGGSVLRKQVPPGAGVVVPVVIDLGAAAGANLKSLTLGMHWSVATLRFDSLKAGAFGSVTQDVSEASDGFLSASVVDATGTTTSVTMATAYFTAAATPGGTRIRLDPSGAVGNGTTDLTARVRTQPFAVCVAGQGFWGDANGDAAVNIIDAQQIARYSVGLAVADENALFTQGDVNADGDVNIIDAQQVARFSVDLPASPRTNTVLFAQPAVASMFLDEGTRLAPVGGSIVLTPSLADSLGASIDGCAPVTWASTAPAVATVDSTGRVVGVSDGTAIITATAGLAATGTLVSIGGSGLAPASIAVLAGDNQWGYDSNPLPVPAQVVVRDAAGLPLRNVPVTFSVNAGTMNAGKPLVVKTDADGIATATQWFAPVIGSTATMNASVGGDVSDAIIAVNLVPPQIGQTSCVSDGWGTRCWGNGTRGQLGNGTNTSSLVPVSLNPDVTAFRMATKTGFGDHFCGLDASGTAYCWGENSAGQLGDGSHVGRNVPTSVVGGFTFQSLAAGTHHTCGVTTAGDVYCWGLSYAGQLGDSTIGTSRIVPTKAKTPAGIFFTQVAAGYDHTCALTAAGDVYCWGTNTTGQLGDGTISPTPRSYPALVTGGLKLTKIAAGPSGACGLTAAGAAWCWGLNSSGQLGNGNRVTSAAPVAVQGGNVFTGISVAVVRACGEKAAESTVWCWGGNNGQLGDGTAIDRPAPSLLPYSVSQLIPSGAINAATCALGTGANQVYCWGANTSGQLGDGSTTASLVPLRVPRAGATAGAVTAMQPTSIAMLPQSAAIGTAVPLAPAVSVFDGLNNPVQGATVNWTVQTGGGSVVSATSLTDATGVALSGGWTLGTAVGEQKMQASVSNIFLNGAPAPNVITTFIAYGTNTPALAVKISGDSVYSSTNNGGNSTGSRVPQVVKVVDASSNPIASVAVTFTLGTSSGTLQNGSTSAVVLSDIDGLATLPESYWTPNVAQPSVSTLNASIAGIATPLVFTQFRPTGAFDVTSCALTAAGAAMCAGLNTFGGVGDGTTTNRSVFTPVSGGLTFTAFAEGISATKCGLVGTAAYCWGLNSFGQLGDSTQVNRTVPTLVKGGLAFAKIYTQMYTTCGLTTANQLYCWGWTGNPGWGEGEAMRGRIHLTPTLVTTGGLTFTKVGLADDGMCGLTAAGAIHCRDARYRSDGGTSVPTSFVQWPGGPWIDVAVGNTVACALDVAGLAYCVGGGAQGGSGLGSINGSAVGSSVPTQVLGGVTFADIHAGNFRACARRSNGELYCWGIIPGNGAAGVVDRPVLVPGLNVSSVRITSFRNECAKTNTSLLYCWGSNSTIGGMVGDGTTIDRNSPVAIPNWPDGPPAGVAVAMYPDVSGYTQSVSTPTATPPSVTVKDRLGTPVAGVQVTFTATPGNGTVSGGTAVTNASGVATAGSWTMPTTPGAARLDVTASGAPPVSLPATVLAAPGSLTIVGGDTEHLPDFYPTMPLISVVVRDSTGVPIAGMPVTFATSAGNGTVAGGSSVNVLTNATGIATLSNSWAPPLAIGTSYTLTATVPAVAPQVITASRLAWTGNGANNPSPALCRLTATGAAYCWGGNNQGEVGDGSNTPRLVPTVVAGGLSFTTLANGDAGLHHCALTIAGVAYCWGNNDAGQLGNGTQVNSNVPVAVIGGLTFTSLATGPFATCGIATGGAMYCWGLGGFSFRGDGELFTVRTSPTVVNTAGHTFVRVAIGGRALCALDAAGQAFCWGENGNGHLGNGTTTSATTPQATSSGLRFAQLTAGFDFNCGVTSGGTAACWGYNGQGSIGNGSTVNQTTPLPVASITGALEIRAGVSHVCSRTSSSIYCWGADYSGQVGDGVVTPTNRMLPVQTAMGITPSSLGAFSYSASCASAGSQLYCWGNSTGIGDGSTATHSLPTAVQWPEASTTAPATILALTPATRSFTAATALITVRVVNNQGTAAPLGTAVTFVVKSGGGIVNTVNAVTDASGNASTTWTLAGASGTVGTLEAQVTNLPTVVFTGTVP